jgi:LiaI-LiaF-like transmembrane region
MKSKHFFWGALFITLGTLALLNNFYYLNFSWSDLWKFWPVVLVLWGLTIVIKNAYFKGVLATTSGILLAFVIFATFKAGTDIITDNVDWDSKDFNISVDNSDNYRSYNENYDPSIKEAKLHFESGAGSFLIRDTTTELISAKTNGIDYDFNIHKDTDNNVANILLSAQEHHFRFRHGKISNKAEVSLNSKPIWELNLDIGAASTEFDLRPYKTRKVDISMGAASLKLKLGDNVEESHVDISGGASSIEIYVPEKAGCDIRTDIALSSKSFSGFNKVSDDHYQTENFDNSKNKIYLNIETGVSSVKVVRTND